MSVPVRTLEPGAVYEGLGEQLREIVSIDSGRCVYRMTDLGFCKRRFRVDGEREMTCKHFAEWAKREVA